MADDEYLGGIPYLEVVIEDIKDIIYSQDGTQPADHVSTGALKQHRKRS